MGNVTSSSAPAVPNTFNYFSQGRDWTGDADGEHQSPIDIVPGTTVASDDTMKMELFLGDKPLSNLKVVDTGATLLLEGAVSKLKATDVNGDAYDFEAIQFHFHAPSEHTINGGFYELELHIVHQMTPESQARAKTQRNLAVVAVFFQLDKKSTSGHPFFDALNIKELGSNITLNMNHLLGEDLVDGMKYFAYQGSLTTPPCTENANFYVFEKPLPISQEQLKEFTMRWADNPLFANGNGNNRPVQPLNGRTVKHSCSCCVKPASHEHKRHIEEVIPEGLPSFEIPQPFPLVSFNHKISLNNHHFTSKNTVLNPASNQESLENVANSNLSLDKFMGNALSSNLKVSGSNTLTSGAQGGMTDSQADAIYNKMGQMAKFRGNANSNKVGGLISRPRIANILKKIVK